MSQPTARFQDGYGQMVEIVAPQKIAIGAPAVVSITSVPGAQRLRVNSVVAGTAAATFQPGAFDQMLLGWGFQFYYPRPGFAGNLFAAITGKGAPSVQELEVLERYMASLAGA